MKRYILALASFTILIQSSIAQNDAEIVSRKTFACVGGNASGLLWNNGKWETKRFQSLGKFILTIAVIEVKKRQIIHFNMKSDADEFHCASTKEFNLDDFESCTQHGMSVVFSESTGHGGVSYLIGSTTSDNTRDSLSVEPFVCQEL